jgi:predicted nucleic acid-binding protein
MIADTTFISDLLKEFRSCKTGPARAFFARNRARQIRTTIISAAELAVLFPTSAEGWKWLAGWKIYQLHLGVAQHAADIDRHLKASGNRLGENDNWIAGFAAYYREPLISHDQAFDRAPGVRRVVYERT